MNIAAGRNKANPFISGKDNASMEKGRSQEGRTSEFMGVKYLRRQHELELIGTNIYTSGAAHSGIGNIHELLDSEWIKDTGGRSGKKATSEYQYLCFPPSHQLRTGLVSEEVLDDIKSNGKTVLSVGAGYAFTERVLVKKLGVNAEQITLADRANVMPKGFKTLLFDMEEEWKLGGKKYDYILFAQSIILPNERSKRMGRILEKAYAALNDEGQIRITGTFSPEEITNLRIWLGKRHPEAELATDDELYLIVIRKGIR